MFASRWILAPIYLGMSLALIALGIKFFIEVYLLLGHVFTMSEADLVLVLLALVAGGFTSIVDLAFGADGTLYVVELDAAGWLAAEILSGGFPISPVDGGRVQACDVRTGQCVVRAAGLDLPAAITIGKDGVVWIAENATIRGGAARVRALP